MPKQRQNLLNYINTMGFIICSGPFGTIAKDAMTTVLSFLVQERLRNLQRVRRLLCFRRMRAKSMRIKAVSTFCLLIIVTMESVQWSCSLYNKFSLAGKKIAGIFATQGINKLSKLSANLWFLRSTGRSQ